MPAINGRIDNDNPNPRPAERDLVSYINYILQATDYFKQNYNRLTTAQRETAITDIRIHVRHLYDIDIRPL